MGYYYYGPYGAYRAPPSPPSILDGLTLSPLPYPVLLILAVISLLLWISWRSSYEEVIEETEDGINWLLLAIPVLLVLIVKWLSSRENQRCYGYYYSPYCYSKKVYAAGSGPTCEGGGGASPWGVAALIILLLVLVQFQSILP